uniref:Tail-specific protease n=1 Tax=Gongylonema pulchrum TaxID=637853 RepID=A0A183EXT8_9BILA
LAAAKRQIQHEKDRLTRYMEKARRMIEDLEEQNRAFEGGALSRHEFDSIRRDRDAYKQTQFYDRDLVETINLDISAQIVPLTWLGKSFFLTFFFEFGLEIEFKIENF